MPFVVVTISNIPPDIDEKDLAELIVGGMEKQKVPFRETFLTCEVLGKKSMALLEFECETISSHWKQIENININGKALQISSYKIIQDSTNSHMNRQNDARRVDNPDSAVEDPKKSTPTSSPAVTNTSSEVSGSFLLNNGSASAITNTETRALAYEDMDVDACVESAESSPLIPSAESAGDELLRLLSDLTKGYSPPASVSADIVEEVESQSAPKRAVNNTEVPSKKLNAGSHSSAPNNVASEIHLNGSVPVSKNSEAMTLEVPSLPSKSVPLPSQNAVALNSVDHSKGPKVVVPNSRNIKVVNVKCSVLPGIKTQGVSKAPQKPVSLPPLVTTEMAPVPRRTLHEPNRKVGKRPYSAKHKIVFFDLETTGLDRNTCEILQIATAYEDLYYNVFIKPLRHIPAECSAVNGLTYVRGQLMKNGVVVEVTEPKEAWIGLIKFFKSLGQVFLVGHNADWFDFPLLARDIKRHGLTKEIQSVVLGCIDSLPMFRSRLPRHKSFKQDVLAAKFGISTKGAHDALGDVQILDQLCQRIGITSLDMKKYCKPITKYL